MKVNLSRQQLDRRVLHNLTKRWGTRDAVSLYLDRCQVDTPDTIVGKVWEHIEVRRSRSIGKVVDFGAGDGRFSRGGNYVKYCGYEIDPRRSPNTRMPEGASLVHQCAFSHRIEDADVCLGNPPYVRNQDLPEGWRQQVADSLFERTGIRLSGLANAWQYFFLLSIASTKDDGLVALVIPYEWVSRPSVLNLREFVRRQEWEVRVYRLRDDTFKRVLTTSSITIIDKGSKTKEWHYYEETDDGTFRALPSVTDSSRGAVTYLGRPSMKRPSIYAKRGLSPGTQNVLVLTEGERARTGLRIGTDVVPCITSLRSLDPTCSVVSESVFNKMFRFAGRKCWLIRTDRKPSARLHGYLASIPPASYQTATCLNRGEWWRFAMPAVPSILAATGFRHGRPKMVVNQVRARAVGSVSGIYGVPTREQRQMVDTFQQVSLSNRIVPHSNGLRKVEIRQLNAILDEIAAQRQR